MTINSLEEKEIEKHEKIGRKVEKIVKWVLLIFATLFATLIFSIFCYGLLKISFEIMQNKPEVIDKYISIVFDHFAATIGLPLSGLASLSLVLFLKYSTGPLEFEGLGFKFKGASGPVVLWVLCFLSIAGAIKLLW